jgi:hypothetical protein
MSDWHETKETQERDISHGATGEKLSPQGIAAMQGNIDAQGDKVPEQPDNADEQVTIHPHKNPETLPSPEVEPVTIKNPEGGKPRPPEGWHPGGPEAGG